MADTIAEPLAAERLERRPWAGGLVCDAPADADEVLAAIPVWPRWIGLALALGVSLLLWAAIIWSVGWAIGRWR